jgi:PIN domain nuclease of toxin-antitoxin system
MNFVTDTHPLLHFFFEPRRNSAKVKSLFTEAIQGQVGIFVPGIVLLELSLLMQKKRIALDMPFSKWTEELFLYPGISLAALDLGVVHNFHDTVFHKDPFDRAIVATAIALNSPLITNDSVMHQSKPCRLIWD